MRTLARGVWNHLGSRRRTLRSVARTVLTAILLTVIGVECSAAAAAESSVSTRTQPRVSQVPPAARELKFSAAAADDEFLRTGLFIEPLAPTSLTSTRENRELARALLTYRDLVQSTGSEDAVEPLLSFLDRHPDSAWEPALLLDLGIVYRQTGHFSKALQAWQTGWKQTRDLTDPHGYAIANATVARLSQLEAYLGRKELLAPLLDSVHDRKIGGTPAQWLTDSQTGLYEMLHQPETSFLCGPLALRRILTDVDTGIKPSPVALRVLNDAQSTPNGLSLTAVQQIATKAGMHYQMAFRKPGAVVITPAVAHWKVGHYAAIVGHQKGRYLVHDTTFGDDIRVSRATLDEEASGYFLVPAGPLPAGWRGVPAVEGSGIWGRGNTGNTHDDNATGDTCSGGTGCTDYSVELEVVGLQLTDTPVGYNPPVGPTVAFTFVYSHRDIQQPATGFTYTNFGPKWTFNWLSYITDTVKSNGQATVYRRGGGNEPYTFSSTGATTSYTGPYSQSTLSRTVNSSGNSTGFTLTFPNGSYEQFTQPGGGVGQFFMTAVVDAAGNKVTLAYDSLLRITTITDAVGEVSTLSYQSSTSLLVSKITDPFGRAASFTYTADGHLGSITDTLGITSSYTYGQGADPDFINTLTTPYGSTTFTFGDSKATPSLGSTRFLKTTDALGRMSYVEFDQGIDPSDSSNGVPKGPLPANMAACANYLNWRNTFVFNANQYALALNNGVLNYSLAKVVHWLHTSDGGSTSRIKESEKQPLENRVWYNYAGQNLAQGSCGTIYATVSNSGVVSPTASNKPIAAGRVLDDGSTQVTNYSYNPQGNILSAKDTAGRQTTYTYAANNVDLISVANTTGSTQVLETVTYNSQHLPLTITGANGTTTRYAYNSAGQITRYTDQLGHATTYTYDSAGRVKTITGASGFVETFSYDSLNHPAAVTDSGGETLRFTYDAADRVTSVTFPDGTVSRKNYNLLEAQSITDRLGHTTQFTYDADRELTKTTDQLGRVVQRGYNLAGELTSITDPKGHTTTLVLDDEGRTVAKQFPDGTSVSVAYQASRSLTAAVTDALGQGTYYTYNPDGTVATVGYVSNVNTPSVSFSYDPAYVRPVSMTDGNGTTTYSYYPVQSGPNLGANLLQSVTSPVAGGTGSDTVTYAYDALNRIVSYNIDGAAQTVAFDALGRVNSTSNPLDTFTYGYSDGTGRVSTTTAAQGPVLSYSYFGAAQDELLSQVSVATQSGTSLAQLSYTYDANENVSTFTSSIPATQTASYTYDQTDRLLSATIGAASTPQYAYTYDAASNLTSITANGIQQSPTYTSTNSIQSGTYDLNGSPTALAGKTYTWDGARRLASVADATGNASYFTYDGIGNLVRVVDTVNGSVTADHSYLWCGNTRCLSHDNTHSGSPVTAQYFNQGVIVNGTSYYYVRDRLGSVRELISTSGTIAAQYDYDPYGNPITVSGTVPLDAGFQGFFYHAASGLYFSKLRAYDSQHGHWLNRDPAAEAGGINLYSAFAANPTNIVDPTGLFMAGPIGQAGAQALSQAMAVDGMMGGPLDYVGDAIAVASLAYFFYESYQAIKDSQQGPPPDPTPTAPPAANPSASPGTSGSGAGGGNNQPPSTTQSDSCPDDDDDKLNQARAARDALANAVKPQGRKAPAAVTGGYNVNTGEVSAACSDGVSLCAEDVLTKSLNADPADMQFTEAVRPRSGAEQPVCVRCEATYGRDAFPPDTLFQSDSPPKPYPPPPGPK